MTRQEYEHEREILEGMIRAYELRLNHDWFTDRMQVLVNQRIAIEEEIRKEQNMRAIAGETIEFYRTRVETLDVTYEQDKLRRAAEAQRTSRPSATAKSLTRMQLAAKVKLEALGCFTPEQIDQMVRGI